MGGPRRFKSDWRLFWQALKHGVIEVLYSLKVTGVSDMKKMMVFIITLVLTIGFIVPVALAQSDRILVILDCSDAMRMEVKGERMIYIAKKELVGFVEKLKSNSIVGIMVFGHTSNRCDDAELIVPFGAPDGAKVRDALSPLTNPGSRGLFHAMKEGMKLLSESSDNPVMYIITSGGDQCGDRAYVVQDAYEQYGSKARIVIIGMDVSTRDADNLKDLAVLVAGVYKEVLYPQQLNSELAKITQSQHGNLVVFIRGADPEMPQGTLKIFDDRSKLVEKMQIDSMRTFNLNPGSYDIELTYKGRNFWERGVEISGDGQKVIEFVLDKEMGELAIEILDMDNERLKGSLAIMNELDSVLFDGKGKSYYRVSLPAGFYSAEVTVGDIVEYFDYIEIFDNSITDFVASISIVPGRVEVVVNNFDGVPINASVVIEDENGTIVGEAEFTSNYKISLPPGNYTALVTTSSGKQETHSFYMPEGDHIIVAVDIDAPMGSVLVCLNHPNGDEVYGYLKVFDERGRAVSHFEWESVQDSRFTFDLPVGMYRIQADSDGVVRTVDSVHVDEFDETVVYITFPKR